MPKKHLFIFLFLAQQFFTYSQTKLNGEIEKLKNDAAMKHATWSISVLNTKKDSIIVEYNSNISLVPASTMKIVTTGAALTLLGNDFMFETQLQYDGILDTVTGVLKGNVYILGGGDPSLESDYFKNKKDTLTIVEKWALILKTKGIKKIEGAIIADAGIFEDNMVPDQWIWGDMGNYFGAGACGLTYHDNKFTLNLRSGATGSQTTINKIQPAVEGMQIINSITAGGTDDNGIIYGSPYSNYRTAEGTIPANKNSFEIAGSIPDPALFCAQALEQALKNNTISITQKATTVRQLREADKDVVTNRKTLYKNYSPTLDKIVYFTNLKSINLYAEHLLKYIAYKKNGIGKETEGTQIITDFWKSKGVNVSGFFMNDGCGLARANVITTKTETQILSFMSKGKSFNAFYDSFPIAGKTGSISDLCKGTCAENNLCAKSGYITRARGYAGYVKNKKGELLCFSVIANNYDCTPNEMKKKLEKILIAIAEIE